MVERLLNAAAEADERVRCATMAHHLAVSFKNSPDVHENVKATRKWTASNLGDVSLDPERAMRQAGNRITEWGLICEERKIAFLTYLKQRRSAV